MYTITSPGKNLRGAICSVQWVRAGSHCAFPNLCKYQAKPINRTNTSHLIAQRYTSGDNVIFTINDSRGMTLTSPHLWVLCLLGRCACRDRHISPKNTGHELCSKNIIRKRSQEGFCMLKRWSRDMLYSRVDKDGFNSRQKHSWSGGCVQAQKKVWISSKARLPASQT